MLTPSYIVPKLSTVGLYFDAPDMHQRRSLRLQGYDYRQAGAYFVTVCTHDRACVFGDVVDGVMVLNDAGAMVRDAWCNLPNRFTNVCLDTWVVMPNHIHGIIIIVGAGLVPVQTYQGDHKGRPYGDTNPFVPVGTGYTASFSVNAPVEAGLVPAQTQQGDHGGYPYRDIAASVHTGKGLMPAQNQPGDHAQNHEGDHEGRLYPSVHTGKGLVPALNLGAVVGAFKSITTVLYARAVRDSNWPAFHRKLWQRNYYEHIIRNEQSLNRIREYVANNPQQWALDRENPAYVVRAIANKGES